MSISQELVNEFPTLRDPLCLREGRHGPATCGYCNTARSLASEGSHMTFRLHGADEPMNRRDAIRYNLAICERKQNTTWSRVVVDEIRRDGHRILKTGANVYVQLKRKKGTAKTEGYIVECYDNDDVKISACFGTSHIVPADEFVTGRRGTTKVSA
tara:strand:- start:128 stop:595 length:468 start_codon:yes stop_codon:yes gene_type:complete